MLARLANSYHALTGSGYTKSINSPLSPRGALWKSVTLIAYLDTLFLEARMEYRYRYHI